MLRPVVQISCVALALCACGDDSAAMGDTDGSDATGGTSASSGEVGEGSDGPGSGSETGATSGDETGSDTDPTGDPTGDPPACEAVGLEAAPEVWTLPDFSALGVGADLLQQLAGGAGCENEEDFLYTTTDLTGDGRVDLVVTDACDANGVGVDRWIVHPGEDGGFGGAMTWTLPDFSALGIDGQDLLEQLGGGAGCENEEDFLYTTTDLTGDGLVDLVVTDACDANGVGVDRWIVHPGEDGGFGGAMTWTLPDFSALGIDGQDLLEQLAGGAGCENEEDFLYTTTDLTGDGVVDLVVTDACDANGVGVDRWIVHPGEDGGFGGAMTWTLPDFGALGIDGQDLLQQLGGGAGCENEEDFLYTTADLTGDGRVDLVVTDACDANGVGVDRWIVHPGEDGGFGGAMTWTLPDFSALGIDGQDLLEQLAGGAGCENEEDFLYTTADLTGDGRVDLVVTDACDANGVGAERWIVHPGEDGGFGGATTWTLPDFSALGVGADLLEQLGGGAGCENEEDFLYTTTDLTGDGLVDLVVTDGCDANGVGVERWIVHPAICE